jgi:DNA invertase Pin-like site-specific DNA recombinase
MIRIVILLSGSLPTQIQLERAPFVPCGRLLNRPCDTTTPHGVLMLTILGGLAEFERTLIKARTGEGRERAKGRGVRFGRPLKLSAHQRREAIERLDAGDAVVDVARTFGVDRATLYRMRAEAAQ